MEHIVLATLAVGLIVTLAVALAARRSTGRHRALRMRHAAQQYHPVLRPVDGQAAALAAFEEHVRTALAVAGVAERAHRCECHGLQQCPRMDRAVAAEAGRLLAGTAPVRHLRLVGGAR